NTLLADIDANSNSINNVLTTRTQVLYINGQQATVGAIGEKGEQGDAGADGVDGVDGIDGVTGVVVQALNTQDGEVATSTNPFSFDDVIPTDSEGMSLMSLPITPVQTNNLLRIDVVANLACSLGSLEVSIGLFQDGVTNALSCATSSGLDIAEVVNIGLTYWMTAGTTNSTTFEVRGGADDGTTTFNGKSGSRAHGGVMASSITITEYMA
ncbi:MAG: collagen-like protein, partial [Gammaproteobacteria bacterium]|nr:collagen-like protein [Gammaproteobacteria bacterium]